MQQEQCKECSYCSRIGSQTGFWFFGCTHKPYKGRWVIEIEECPKNRKKLQQPTADVVEVKHGEWILDKKITSPIFLNCSLCGNTADKDIHGNYIGITPYCSMCGAKMDGSDKK